VNDNLPARKSIRLGGYDYSGEGMYFVTICTQDRKCLFGKIMNGSMTLNNIGIVVKDVWMALPKRFSNINMVEITVMPNHIHGLITVGAPLAGARINDNRVDNFRATARVAPTHIGNIIGAYKSLVYDLCLKTEIPRNNFLGKLWQRNYYEHIVRDEKDLERIREYIENNPSNWSEDELFV
jgi:REP element-mobilizing transposase RayT